MLGVVGDPGGAVGGGRAMLEGGTIVLAYSVAIDELCYDIGFIETEEYENLRRIANVTQEEDENENSWF